MVTPLLCLALMVISSFSCNNVLNGCRSFAVCFQNMVLSSEIGPVSHRSDPSELSRCKDDQIYPHKEFRVEKLGQS